MKGITECYTNKDVPKHDKGSNDFKSALPSTTILWQLTPLELVILSIAAAFSSFVKATKQETVHGKNQWTDTI